MTTERVAIVFSTDTDESFLVGTKDELKNFANSILTQLEQNLETQSLFGLSVWNSKTAQALTEPLVDVCITGFTVVKDAKDRKFLINKYQEEFGSDPIDWDNRN